MIDNSVKIRKQQGERVRTLRELLNLSRMKMAEHHPNLSKGSIRNWEEGEKSGLTEPGASFLTAVAQKLGVRVTETWLLEGVGDPPEKLPHEALLDDQPLSFKRALHLIGQHAHALTALAKDDTFAPMLRAGEYAIGTRLSTKELSKGLNALCIIETFEGETKIGYLKQDKSGGYTLLDKPINILSAAPVMMVMRGMSTN